ncbi:MAG: hypothetical protein LBM01_01035 [Christensenellaceae bacterium]|jgi:V/A-type H+-transporting ATPase subunit F|nr:hypothetical protein [Christensenellaceae bacterium]
MTDSIDKNTGIRVAVIGEKDIVLPFKALGMEIYCDTTPAGILANLKKFCAEGYALVLITENEARKVEDFIDKRASFTSPIILPIPNGVRINEEDPTASSFAMDRIKKNIERAIGSIGNV